MTILQAILRKLFGDPPKPADIAADLDARALNRSEKLSWRTSIVDLMKLLDLDSSIENRRELARELGYKRGDRNSEEMNVWLHKQVMQQLAENGGNVPDELKG
jgi:hypothetical protein